MTDSKNKTRFCIDREKLATLSNFLQLRMARAAVVRGYECHVRGNAMSVNRLLMVFEDDDAHFYKLRNPNTRNQFPIRAGFLYFIPCNLEVELDISPAVSFLSLHFNLDLFYGFDVFGKSQRCEMLEAPARVSAAKRTLEQDDELRALCRINALILDLCATWLPPQTIDLQKGLMACRKYTTILDFVRNSADAATTVEALADMMGMRNDVFSRTFTRDMGITPKDFLAKTMMRKAARMLHAPGTTVRAVAANLNFSSEYYFSRFFKKHSGQPPKMFQRDAGTRL